jgi:tetratricopeptide (TPR) repeat protein
MAEQPSIHVIDKIVEQQDVYAAIFFSYGIDLAFFEEVILHRLWQNGCRNILVFIDAVRYADTIRDFAGSISWAGIRYILVPIRPPSGYVFHPKMVMLLSERAGRLLVGSGNLTFAGYGQNLETYACIDWDRDNSSQLALFQSAWRFCQALVKNKEWVRSEQVQHVLQKTQHVIQWLHEEPEPNPFFQLLTTLEGPLLPRVRELLAEEEYERITVITPFLDGSASAVEALINTFHPKELRLILQDGRASGDLSALRKLQLAGYPLTVWTLNDTSRYMHAKIYLFQTQRHTHILTGSANCTQAALLASPPTGNVEIALLHTNADINAYHYLFEPLELHSSPTSLDDVTIRPIPPTLPESQQPQLYIYDAELYEGRLSVVFEAAPGIPLDDLQVRLTTFPVSHLNLSAPTREGKYFVGRVQVAEALLSQLNRPVALTLLCKDHTGTLIDVGCNELWITNRDQHTHELRQSKARAIRVGDQLLGVSLESESEWGEFATHLAAIIDLEARVAQARNPSPTSEHKHTGSDARATDTDTETRVIVVDPPDNVSTHAHMQSDIDPILFQESDLYALIRHVRATLPGVQKRIAVMDPDEGSEPSINPTVRSYHPSESTLRRITNLVNKYVRSLENCEYLPHKPIHVILTHYVIFQQLIWLLSKRGLIDDNKLIEWITQINSSFFNPLGDLPPLADEERSRHLHRACRDAWHECNVAPHVMISLMWTFAVLPRVDNHDLKLRAYETAAPVLASMAAIFNINQLWPVHISEYDNLLPVTSDCNFGRAVNDLVAGARRGIAIQLDSWSSQLDLLQNRKLHTHQENIYTAARIAYLTAKYELLAPWATPKELIKLCNYLYDWASWIGDHALSEHWQERMIELQSQYGLKKDLAQSLSEYGMQLYQRKRYERALEILDQAITAANEVGNFNLESSSKYFKCLSEQYLKLRNHESGSI